MISANSGKYPVSAQCEILGVLRSTYYWMAAHPAADPAPDPITDAVVKVFEENRRQYGSPKLKQGLARTGITAFRRRIKRIMNENGLVSAYSQRKYRPHATKPSDADVPNLVAREFDGRLPRTNVVGDLTYVRVGGRWNYVCLLVDLYNREIVGRSAGPRKDASLVKAAFATLQFPISDVEVFHTDRGSEFDNMAIGEMLDVFGVARSLSRKGNPYDNAVIESTNRILKKELIYRQTYATTEQLRRELNSYVWWYNNERMHSTLGYMSPVEFREAGMSL